MGEPRGQAELSSLGPHLPGEHTCWTPEPLCCICSWGCEARLLVRCSVRIVFTPPLPLPELLSGLVALSLGHSVGFRASGRSRGCSFLGLLLLEVRSSQLLWSLGSSFCLCDFRFRATGLSAVTSQEAEELAWGWGALDPRSFSLLPPSLRGSGSEAARLS